MPVFLALQADCSRSSTATRALLRSWRAASPAHAARALGSSADGLLDLAPALRDISRPAAVRAVASQLLSRDEDRVLTHVVSSRQSISERFLVHLLISDPPHHSPHRRQLWACYPWIKHIPEQPEQQSLLVGWGRESLSGIRPDWCLWCEACALSVLLPLPAGGCAGGLWPDLLLPC